MIFSFGKGRDESDDSIEEETLRRWREASERSQAITTNGEGLEGVTLKSGTLSSGTSSKVPTTINLDRPFLGVAESWSMGAESPKDAESPKANWVVTPSEASMDKAAEKAVEKIEQRESPPVSTRIVRQDAQLGVKKQTSPEPLQTKDGRTPPSDPSLSADEDIRRRFGSNLRSALGTGTVIEGKMSFDSPVRIDGNLNGEVTSTSTLIVGEQALVKAAIKVGSLIVLGQVDGDVQATDLIEIRNGGHLEGDIKTARFVMEDGGFFEGAVKLVPTQK